MSLGFGLENINDMFGGGDGIAPVFSASDMAILKEKAVKSINNNLQIARTKKTSNAPYWVRAYNFVEAYRRKEIPWEMMNKRQREFLLQIKDRLR